MWSSIIVYKYIGRTAAVFVHWQRRQPGTGVTSTQDVDGVCRVLWDRVAVQWSQQSLFLLPELSGARICAAGRVSPWEWCSICWMLLTCGKLQAAEHSCLTFISDFWWGNLWRTIYTEVLEALFRQLSLELFSIFYSLALFVCHLLLFMLLSGWSYHVWLSDCFSWLPSQQPKCAIPMASAGHLFLSSDLCCLV